jgi:hypothetical protein
MRALLVGGWVLLAAGPALARADEPTFDKLTPATVGAVKPAAADAKDSAGRKLQKEAYNTRLAQVQALVKQRDQGVIGRAEVGLAVRRLAYAEAELFPDPAAGVRWLDLWVEIVTDLERLSERAVKAGAGSEEEYLLVQVARLNAQIEVLRLKELRGVRSDPEARVKLYEQRVKVLAVREERIKAVYDRGALSTAEYLDAKAARIDAELELVKLKGMM